jgi:nuclear pore complex protein Nup160
MLSEMSAGLLTTEDAENFNSGVCRYFQHILSLFESAEAYSFAADFARLALAAVPHDQSERAVENQDNISSRLFAAELRCSRYAQAYTVLTQFSDMQLQGSATTAWIDAILGRDSPPNFEETDSIRLLQRLPLDLHPHIARVVDDHLSTLAEKQVSIPGLPSRDWSNEKGVDYLRILYALRIGRQDYRGAVSVLMERLYLVKGSGQARNDSGARVLKHTLLALINDLSCVAPDEAYIVAPVRESMTKTMEVDRDPEGRDLETGWKRRRRIVITMEDLRREYQQLLDKCSRIERGDFDFDAGSEEEDEDSDFEGAGTNGVDSMEF